MPDNIDALIANFPGTLQENALRQMQTQLGAQRAQANALALQQQIAAQNALRDIYGNQANWDPNSGLPRPAALPQLMQADPSMGLEFAGAATKLNDVNARAAALNMRTRDHYGGLFQQGVADPTTQFAMSLDPHLPQDQRDQKIAAFQEERIRETATQYGVPDSERDRWESIGRWTPSWILGSERMQARQDAIAKGWKDDNIDYGTGQMYSTNQAYPGLAFNREHTRIYTPSGVSKEAVETQGPASVATGTGPDGKPYSIKFRENKLGQNVDFNDPTKRVTIPDDAKITPISTKPAKLGPGKMMYIKQPGGGVKPGLVSQAPEGGYVDQRGQSVEVVGEVPASSPDYAGPRPSAAGDVGKIGEPYLATLPQNERPLVKALAEGRIAVPTWALRDPQWQQRIANVAQYDPTFDATDFNRRNRGYIEYTSGTQGKNVVSINTALNHAAELWHSTDELASKEVAGGRAGPIVNWIQQTLTKSVNPSLKASLNRFKVNADALGAELERATRGDRTAERGVEEWRASFNAADTPQAIKASIKEAWRLLAGRVDSLEDGFKRAVGPHAEVTDLFTSFAKETYRAFEENKTPPDISKLIKSATGSKGQAAMPGSQYDNVDMAKQSLPADGQVYPIHMEDGTTQLWGRDKDGSLHSYIMQGNRPVRQP